MYRKIFKRVLDVVISLCVLLVTFPFLLLIVLLIKISIKGSPFFVQERPGMNGEIFKVVKFKTMTDECDSEGNLLPDEQRLTSVGKFIRSLSLDELPQFLNVLKGDMSLVGPRPLLVKYLPLYNDFQNRRHEVKPGITGWAQVNGRNAISWQEKFELDVWYVDHISLWLDLKIIFLTLKKVIQRNDINSSINATMETFEGNE